MKKLNLFYGGLIAVGTLVAYIAIGFAGLGSASTGSSSDWSNRPEPYTMTYRGEPLHCLVVTSDIAGEIGGLTCDFDRYYGIGIH